MADTTEVNQDRGHVGAMAAATELVLWAVLSTSSPERRARIKKRIGFARDHLDDAGLSPDAFVSVRKYLKDYMDHCNVADHQ